MTLAAKAPAACCAGPANKGLNVSGGMTAWDNAGYPTTTED